MYNLPEMRDANAAFWTALRTVATSELVVPKSMPTASRCWCGAVDMPGSEICRSAIYETCIFIVCGNKQLREGEGKNSA